MNALFADRWRFDTVKPIFLFSGAPPNCLSNTEVAVLRERDSRSMKSGEVTWEDYSSRLIIQINK